MIVKMKKATVLMYSRLKEQNLNALKKAGVLHIEELEGRGEDYLQAVENLKTVQASLEVVRKVRGEESVDPVVGHVDAGIELAKHINRIFAAANETTDKIGQLKRSIDEIVFWGEFNPADIKHLSEKGIVVSLYKLPLKKLKKLSSSFEFFSVATDKESVGIAVVQKGESDQTDLPDFLVPVELPERGIPELQAEINTLAKEEKIKLEELDTLARDHGALVYLEQVLEEELEFSKVSSASTVEDESEVSVVSGYVPVESVNAFERCCSDSGMGYTLSEVSPDDHDVPVLIRNNPLVKLIKPVFDLLGTVPGYREYDISPFFLIFFPLFFAMIIGDAGYGLILLAGGLFGLIGGAIKKKRAGLGLKLLLSLSFMTVLWGSITGSWFGSQVLVEGTFLEKLVIPSMYAFDPKSGDFIKYFCFIIAMVHLTIAHLWNFMRLLTEKPFIKAFAQLGQLSLLYGLFFIVLNLLLKKSVPEAALYLIGGGLGAILIFSEQEGNFFKGVLKGFSNIVIIFLDAIAALSDIISYIRLFAVGLASLEIAKAFNSMAAGIADSDTPGVGVLGAVVILFLGHTLNMILGGLSVVVHGVRLNMLEFSGHLGMEWSGDLYDPFRDRKMMKIKE